ncbi:hypothetical protein COCNU_scaffold001711G000010 [Cocos nucifera]|nr:hypothetical protein [Cocos nucifera]
MPIQAASILETITVVLTLTLPDDASAPAPPEQGEVVEKRRKRERNTIAKKVKRKVGCSGSESSSQEQDFLDDREIVHSLMEGSVLPHIIDKMVQIENVESWGIIYFLIRR